MALDAGIGANSASSGGYDIDNSYKNENDNTERMYRAWGGITANTKTWTVSLWVKRTELGACYLWGAGTSGNDVLVVDFDSSDRLGFRSTKNAANDCVYRTNRVFRDTSAWYHLVFAVDTTSSTAGNRLRIYVNGVEETSFATETNFDQNDLTLHNANGSYMEVGSVIGESPRFNGYIAEVNSITGTQYAPTAFGEYDADSGIWVPIKFAGSYAENSIFLEFKDSSSLGTDTGGNGNTFTLQNLSAADQATDTPTNNFCTLNPIAYNTTYTASEGNTKWSKSDTTYGLASGTQYVGGGKWYWEIKATDFGTYSSCAFGILDAAKPTLGPSENGYEDPSLSATDPEILAMTGSPNGWVMNSSSTISNNGSTNSVDYTFNEGDILAFALDMDNGGYWMGNSRYSGVANGSFWIAPGGTSTSGSVATTDPSNGNYALVGDGGGTNNGTPNFNGGTITGGSLLTAGFTLVTPLLGVYHSNTTVTLEVNFGGFTSYGENGGYSDANGHGNFAYAVPSGFYALCTKNLAEYGG